MANTTDAGLVPDYVAEPIDLVKDGVRITMEKLSFQATGGKYIEGIWEAPMPAAVNPLSPAEVDEFSKDSRLMSVEFLPQVGTRMHRTKKKVSAVKNYRPAVFTRPFHGYKSDPPKAKVFKEDEPVGALSTALKAAGEMSAVAKKGGEDDEVPWQLIKSFWGADVGSTKEYLLPDLSNTSEKDVVKFVRRTTHEMYGFTNETPSVVVDGGSWRPETMKRQKSIDYHRVYLALRFIGEYIQKYTPKTMPDNWKLYMAPAMIEFADAPAWSITSGLAVPDYKSTAFPDLVQKTLKFYTQTIEAYGASSYLLAKGITVAAGIEYALTPNVIREISSQNTTLTLRLPSSSRPKSVMSGGYDLSSTAARKTTNFVKLSNLKLEFQIGWRTASAMAFEMFFRTTASTERAAQVRAALRRFTSASILTKVLNKELKEILTNALPSDLGAVIFKLLVYGSNNDDDPVVKFAELLKYVDSNHEFVAGYNPSMEFARAAVNTDSIDGLVTLINSGLQRANTFAHGSRRFSYSQVPGSEMKGTLERAVKDYTADKIKYWSQHYASRVIEFRNEMKNLTGAISNMPKSAKKAVFGSIAGEAIPTAALNTFDAKTLMEYLEYKEVLVTGIVQYSFLKACYPRLDYRIDSRLRVTVELSAGAARSVLLKTAENYIRKRTKWKTKSNEEKLSFTAEVEVEEVTKALMARTRKADMAAYLDKKLAPKVTWASLLELLDNKTRVTQNSLSRVIKESVYLGEIKEPDFVENGDVVANEKRKNYKTLGVEAAVVKAPELAAKAVEEKPAELRFADPNAYGAFFASSSSDSSVADSETDDGDEESLKSSWDDISAPDLAEDTNDPSSMEEEAKPAVKARKAAKPSKEAIAKLGDIFGLFVAVETSDEFKPADSQSLVEYFDMMFHIRLDLGMLEYLLRNREESIVNGDVRLPYDVCMQIGAEYEDDPESVIRHNRRGTMVVNAEPTLDDEGKILGDISK